MSQLHRLKWIDEQIRAGRCPNCRRIADEFEISTRQASRGVEYLRYSMGAPVEYSAERGGYYYMEATYVFPAAILTETEKEALSYLAYRYARMGSEQGAHLAELFRRISGAEKTRDPFHSGFDLPVPPLAENEARACRTLASTAHLHIKTRIEYRDAREADSVRGVPSL
jgi:predicted DNA-binding transcriptional regulator YafY